MKKKFVQIAALILVMILFPMSSVHAVADEAEQLIRIGLYYGGNVLPGANLLNDVGSGYRLGYMEGDAFIELGATGETAISMVKTQNVCYTSSLPGGGYGYSDQVESNIVVGCYHLRLPESYGSFEEAEEAAWMVGGFPAWIKGEYQVRIGAYPSAEEAEQGIRELGISDLSVVGTSSYGITVVITGTDQPVFQFDGGNEVPALTVMPGLDDSEKTITHFKGLRYYGGFRYERISGGDLTVVNLVGLEDYIKGVIPHEMSPSWPLEALKAQAVCARSYTLTNLNKHRSYHFDLCNTTDCQVYYGINSSNETTDRAVEETMGEFAWYDGEIIEAYYHSSDGGATENSENVWRETLPYLRGVEDPFEALVEDRIPGYHWTRTYTGKELMTRLNSMNYPCDEIVDLRVSEITDTGNVYSVSFTDVNGTTWTISKDDVRIELGLNSLRFTIAGSGEEYFLTDNQSLSALQGAWALDGDGDPVRIRGGSFYAITGDGVERVSAPAGGSSDGTFVISGTGHGHNLGMSQWGAYAMAAEGYTYKDILEFYFTGIEIES